MFKQLFSMCAMGGYGKYIWPCYAILLILISWQIFATVRRDTLIHNKLKQSLRSEVSRDKQAPP